LKPLALVLAAVAFAAAAGVALSLIRRFAVADDPLAMIVGATVGTMTGIVAHSRQPGAAPTRAARFSLGAALAATSLLVALVLHGLGLGFRLPEVTVPMSALGSFVFPFVFFGSTWKALRGPATGPRE
jgi:hypothetical protein